MNFYPYPLPKLLLASFIAAFAPCNARGACLRRSMIPVAAWQGHASLANPFKRLFSTNKPATHDLFAQLHTVINEAEDLINQDALTEATAKELGEQMHAIVNKVLELSEARCSLCGGANVTSGLPIQVKQLLVGRPAEFVSGDPYYSFDVYPEEGVEIFPRY